MIKEITKDAAKRRAIVMGGSFNPPTIAHHRLMMEALDASGAEMGIFVPASSAYVEKKMAKSKGTVFSEKRRFSMLQAMCDNGRMAADPIEFTEGSSWQTFGTLCRLQEKYPWAEIWFIAGGDKLHVIPRWHEAENFVRRFKILATSRDGKLPDMDSHPFYKKYGDSFRMLKEPDGMADVSSTKVRELIARREKGAAKLMHQGAWNILNNG